MTHLHSHSHALPRGRAPLGPMAAKAVVGLLGVIGIAVIAGLVVLCPNKQEVDIPMPFQNATGAAVTTEAGHVLSSEIATCGSPSAGTVYTLVLAYAGSALPLLLLFSVANRSVSDVLTTESVAIEIARSAVGGIALALSVPLTTAIAAMLATPASRCGTAHA
ncbi:YibE/F family protein [Mycobacterium sp.]|uniref:YibE/F family protein n=1 Tax=Mycobacterium sp. TaxID=1785 RepID=UPI003BB03479